MQTFFKEFKGTSAVYAAFLQDNLTAFFNIGFTQGVFETRYTFFVDWIFDLKKTKFFLKYTFMSSYIFHVSVIEFEFYA